MSDERTPGLDSQRDAAGGVRQQPALLGGLLRQLEQAALVPGGLRPGTRPLAPTPKIPLEEPPEPNLERKLAVRRL